MDDTLWVEMENGDGSVSRWAIEPGEPGYYTIRQILDGKEQSK